VPGVSLELLPARVYVERAAAGRLLNFDLRLTNTGLEDRRLTAVEVEVLDRAGTRVLKRVADEHGLRPAIETIPDRVVPADGSLLVFNPFHTVPAAVDLHTVRCTCTLEDETVRGETSPVEYEQRTELHLPLSGRVFVAAGHDFLSPHRRIDPDHPFAAQLGVRTNSGRYADDYTQEVDAFGAPVRAPGAGTVVAALADVPDNTLGPGGVEFAEPPPDPAAAIFGNHIVIDHGRGEFSLIGHLQHGSLEVEPGEAVEARQALARMGLSGNTDYVHIHYQLQDGPDARTAEGLPFRFAGLGPLEPGTSVEVA